MERGGEVREDYWSNDSAAYKPYTDGVDGERFFQCLICLCVIYFVARLFFDGIVVFLIVGLTVGLISLLLNGQLVYKPIVHACGHIFCFWCAYVSVNSATRSTCPRCRRPYLHIPRVCKALHLLLQRVEPELYQARTENFEAMEAQNGVFSLSLDDELETVPSESLMECLRNWCLSSSSESMGMTRPSTESFDKNGIHTPRSPLLTPETQAPEVGESSKYSLLGYVNDINGASEGAWGSMCAELLSDIFSPESLASMFAESASTWSSSDVDSYVTNEDTPEAQVDKLNILVDLLCSHGDEILFRPIVLNCGHVFCERCIAVPRGAVLKCPACKRHQPGLLSQVCGELDTYLRKAFPLEYNEQAVRVLQVLKPIQKFGCLPLEIKKGLDLCTRRRQQVVAINNALVCDSFPDPRKYPRRIVESINPTLRGPLHFGIVCDGCGMVPIIGPRFECRDCTKEFGFDLCETCHYSGFDLTGHVHQEHTSDHRMQVWTNQGSKNGLMQRGQVSQVRGRRCLASHCAREAELAQDDLEKVQKS